MAGRRGYRSPPTLTKVPGWGDGGGSVRAACATWMPTEYGRISFLWGLPVTMGNQRGPAIAADKHLLTQLVQASEGGSGSEV